MTRATGSSTSTTRRTRTRSSTSSTSGRAEFELDGERVDAPAGTFVFARPGVKRTAFAEEPETTILALGGTPGAGVRARRLGALGPARRRSTRPASTPRRPTAAASWSRPTRSTPALLYNLACCESLAGRTTDAIEHLRRAIELSERFSRVREGRLRLRPDPRRARVQGADRLLVVVFHRRLDGEPRMPTGLVDRTHRRRETRVGECADRDCDDIQLRLELVEDGCSAVGAKRNVRFPPSSEIRT